MSVIINGTDGVTFNDSSLQGAAAAPYGLKNRIINGAFQIAQRATSATMYTGGNIYATVDRWYVYSLGTPNLTNITAAQIAGTGNNKNLFQITGGASITGVGVGQRIEQLNSYDMAGQTATLSVSMANSLLTSVTWAAYYANTADTFGTISSPTKTLIATGTFTVTSTLTNYNTQINIPAAATTGIEILFTVGAQTSGTWQLGNVQLEVGSTATPFERRLYNQELDSCQRYYYRLKSTGSNTLIPAWAASGAIARCMVQFPVPMRASPTALEQSGTAIDYAISYTTLTTNCTNVPTFGGSSSVMMAFVDFPGGPLTAGQGCAGRVQTSTAYLGFSAEL